MIYSDLPKRVSQETDPRTKIGLLVIPFVFGREVQPGATIDEKEYAAMFAYKAMLDMHIESQHALMILRFFRAEFEAFKWDRADEGAFILSLNDGRYAVVITEPECRRIYDYRECVDRTHPTKAIPLPAPVVQASVNLSKVIVLDLPIR